MDPKQTEGQNSGSGTLSTGANISRTMDALNVNERKSATSNSPFAKHHFDKVAPGTGDILIDPSAGSVISSSPAEKKGINRGRLIQFGLIFGGIALVALVIFTVVMVINNQPKDTNKTNNPNNPAVAGSAKELFTGYLDLLVFGPEGGDTSSDKELGSLIYNADFYAITIIDEPASESKSAYIEELNSKWNSFISVYNTGNVNANRLADVSLYFYDFAKIDTLTENEVYDIYISSDKNLDTAKNQITELISSTSKRPTIEYFVNIRRNYALATLNILSEADKANCLSKETLFANCNLNDTDAFTQYTEAVATLTDSTSMKRRENIESNALIPLEDLEQEFYGDSEDDAVNIEDNNI